MRDTKLEIKLSRHDNEKNMMTLPVEKLSTILLHTIEGSFIIIYHLKPPKYGKVSHVMLIIC